MDDLRQLQDEVSAGLRKLQRIQAMYDDEMWEISNPAFEKLRHVHLHLSITIGKLAKLLETRDHHAHRGDNVSEFPEDELAPIIADLLMHSAQIANCGGLNLGNTLIDRYRANAQRFSPKGRFAI